MAISHKRMRKINIDGKIYYYKITHSSGYYSSRGDYCGDDYYPEIRVVIEYPDGEVVRYTKDWGVYKPFTPKNVREFIEENQ